MVKTSTSIVGQLRDCYRGRRVLVTGHTGFKGSWLCMVLRQLGAEVTGLALAPEANDDHFVSARSEQDLNESIIGDIRTPGLVDSVLQRTQPEFVFHLAAQPLVRKSYTDPVETYSTNVMGSLNVLEAIRRQESVRALVYVTSDKCYFNHEWEFGYREIDRLGGHDPYSASKALAELLLDSHWKSYYQQRPHFGAASVRAGNVIGGGDFAKDRIIPDCVRAAANDLPIVLRKPRSTRPWQHVLDPLFGYLRIGMKLLDKPKDYSGPWNFGPDPRSIQTVQALVEEFTKYWPRSRFELMENSSDPHEAGLLHLNCDKARFHLHWEPTWNFANSIKYTVEWYRAWHSKSELRQVSTMQINQFMEHHS